MKQNHALFLMGIIGLAGCLAMSGCSTWNPYRPEIHQGNIVSAEAIDRLKVGMNPTQVQAILGTPVTQDFFQVQRWDYLHYASRAGNKLVLRRLSLWFEEGRLTRWDSEGLPESSKEGAPSEIPAAAPAAPSSNNTPQEP